MTTKITFADVIDKLPLPATEKWSKGVWDISPFQHGSMSVILYTPKFQDFQTPHTQDEIYIAFKGKGQLITPAETFDFVEGDVLFVPAGDEHRFENFTEDLMLWVIFWGPEGGEL